MTTSLPLFLDKLAPREASMGTAKIPKLMILTVLLILTLNVDCQHLPLSSRPLCISQFALVNHACAMLPYNPNPAPLPPSPIAPDQIRLQSPSNSQAPGNNGHGHSEGHGHGHGHNHGHSHRHGSRHKNHQTPAEQDCCRWLREVDDECVCELLVHLPIFLRKPLHDYTITVDPSCRVTFYCGGRL